MSWTALEYVLPDEPFTEAGRPILDGFLDRYRASLLNRCSGLTAGQLAERSVPPSNPSLIGIARHLTDVELSYFRGRWGGQEVASYYVSEDRPDADFEDASRPQRNAICSVWPPGNRRRGRRWRACRWTRSS